MLNLNKLLVEEVVNYNIFDGPQNFVYAFSGTVCEVHGSNRGKDVINLSSGGSSKFSDTNKCKWLSHGIMAGLAWHGDF